MMHYAKSSQRFLFEMILVIEIFTKTVSKWSMNVKQPLRNQIRSGCVITQLTIYTLAYNQEYDRCIQYHL